MRKILDIYAEYKIMPSLQEHMLRVAAVASLICDNFTEFVDKEKIVTTCLLHDMGNIIKFKTGVIPEFFEPEGVEYWQKVKENYIAKYGSNEHEANIKIMQELGMPEDMVFIVDQNRFGLICKHKESSDMKVKIVHYSDGRVDPHGVVSYEERMEEGKRRYSGHKASIGGVTEEKRLELVACGKEIEKQIFAKCRIKPEDITNETVVPIVSELRNFVIKLL